MIDLPRVTHLRDEPAAPVMLCSICDYAGPLAGHQRCRACQILIGPGHVETTARDGLCEDCWERAR